MDRLFLLAILVFPVAGCSVNSALQGRPEPAIGVVKVGANRDQILENLGSPVIAYKGPQGGTDLFRVKLGLPGDAQRALGWAGLDLLTLGFWELVGSTVEDNQGSSLQLAVGYDGQGKVTNFSSREY